jgi:cell division septum initiation protein DivIVA
MNPDLEVDTDDLRHAASALTGTADRVTAAPVQAPPAVPTPRWATSDASARAVDAARAQLARLGADLAGTARQIVETADAYEAADARAATRLRSAR